MNILDQLFLVLGHLLSIMGVIFALLLLARSKGTPRRPSATMAWFLSMLFIPWLSIPLYMIFGGRKIRKLARKKGEIEFSEKKYIPNLQELDFPSRTITLLEGSQPVSVGNHIEILEDPIENYERLMKEIENAKESIDITTFILSKDDVGNSIVDALAKRASEGIKVRLLLDAIGSRPAKGRFVDRLRKAGGKVGVFMPVLVLRTAWSANLRNHRKIYLFDRKTAIIGGRNLGEDYMGPEPKEDRWRDFAIAIQGPAVASIAEVFAADWNFATDEDISDEIEESLVTDIDTDDHMIVQTVPSGPDQKGDTFYEALLGAMFQAQKRIWIVTPYFLPDEMILHTLTTLARIGRDVRVIVPKKSDHPVVDLARRYFLRELTKSGVKVHLYTPGMIHTKLLLIDDETASVGSANMDMRSLYLNFEIAMFIYSRRIAGQIEEHMEDLMSKSEIHAQRPARRSDIIGETLENISGLLGPLL